MYGHVIIVDPSSLSEKLIKALIFARALSYCARSQVPGLTQIFVIGFFEEKEFAPFISSISSDLRVPVK